MSLVRLLGFTNARMRVCRRPLSRGCDESRGRVRGGKRQLLCGSMGIAGTTP